MVDDAIFIAVQLIKQGQVRSAATHGAGRAAAATGWGTATAAAGTATATTTAGAATTAAARTTAGTALSIGICSMSYQGNAELAASANANTTGNFDFILISPCDVLIKAYSEVVQAFASSQIACQCINVVHDRFA